MLVNPKRAASLRLFFFSRSRAPSSPGPAGAAPDLSHGMIFSPSLCVHLRFAQCAAPEVIALTNGIYFIPPVKLRFCTLLVTGICSGFFPVNFFLLPSVSSLLHCVTAFIFFVVMYYIFFYIHASCFFPSMLSGACLPPLVV